MTYVRSAILVGAKPLMAEWGQDADALAAELGIDPLALRDPDVPVPVSSLMAFYEQAAQRTGCRSFGLRMAARILQEHLQAQGRSFQDIRDAVRADLAAKYLRDSRLSLTQIADVLGYSELSAFSRSFRRWHGVPPRSLRRGSVAESRPRTARPRPR